jgi:hypothetical protein
MTAESICATSNVLCGRKKELNGLVMSRHGAYAPAELSMNFDINPGYMTYLCLIIDVATFLEPIKCRIQSPSSHIDA